MMRMVRLAGWCAVLLACLLAACANDRSYVALLPSPDGSVGKVVVNGPRGTQVISQARYGALLNGSAAPKAIDDQTLQRDFADAMAARPELPVHFILYFETGTTQLTPESQALLPGIVETAAKRSTVDVSIIGHSDTVGKADVNEALSLKRAQAIAEQISSMGLKADHVVIERHGKRNLLIPTPDETPEPRNRRVEISIR
jgi:outer membrane protein OmpA-like peptidoglycan-associated protein